MAFRDLRDIIGPLVLPVGGKDYTLPVVSTADGARIVAATDGDTTITGQELNKILLGDVLAELEADKVHTNEIDRIYWTALADVQKGRTIAELIWENGIDPKAFTATPNRATRRAKTAASSTKPPASGSTQKKTPPKTV